MFTFLLVVHAIISASLVAVILMQRSEGGGLGVGGSPSGLMSARGAADFLTRATTILASAFILLSIGLAALATFQRGSREIDTSLARPNVPVAPVSNVPLAADPLAAAAAGAAANGPASGTDPIVPATAGTAGPATAPAATRPATRRAGEPAVIRERAATPKPASSLPVDGTTPVAAPVPVPATAPAAGTNP